MLHFLCIYYHIICLLLSYLFLVSGTLAQSIQCILTEKTNIKQCLYLTLTECAWAHLTREKTIQQSFIFARERWTRDSTSKSLSVSLTDAVPRLGVAIVPNLYVHLMHARWQHREKTGDVCFRPKHSDTFPPSYKHDAVIVLLPEVQTLDGENSVACTKKDKQVCQLIFPT